MLDEYVRTTFAVLTTWLTSPVVLLALAISPPGPAGPPLQVSKETTFLTEPLTDSGEIDFIAGLNRHYGAGVDHDDNAAVILVPICAQLDETEPEGGGEWLNQMQRRLGNDPQLALPKLVSPNASKIPAEGWDACRRRPWLRAENREVAEMLLRNEEALSLVHVAAQRPAYFRPIFTQRPNGTLIASPLSDVQNYRTVCQLLSARAMLAIQEQRFEDARRDLVDMQRLARLVSHSPTEYQWLMGCLIQNVAIDVVESVFVSDSKLPTRELRAYLNELKGMSRFYTVGEVVHFGERISALQMVDQLRMRGTAAWAEQNDGALIRFFTQPSKFDEWFSDQFLRRLGRVVDWGLVAKTVNIEYDEVVEIFREEPFKRVLPALDAVHTHRGQMAEKALSEVIERFLWGTRASRSEVVGRCVCFNFLLGVKFVAIAEQRLERKLALSLFRTALVTHFRVKGAFPKELKELVPDLITTEELERLKLIANEVSYERDGKTFRLVLDEFEASYPLPGRP